MKPIRPQYEAYGAAGFYERCGDDYRNPHEPVIGAVLARAVAIWRLDLSQVLDLACGSGEVTLALRELGAQSIEGIDPYTVEAYVARTGSAAQRYTFAAIAAGALAGRRYSLIVCSFALHLAPESRLPLLCYQLAQISPVLLVVTPHKRPHLRTEWGWNLAGEFVLGRVRARFYNSSSGTTNETE